DIRPIALDGNRLPAGGTEVPHLAPREVRVRSGVRGFMCDEPAGVAAQGRANPAPLGRLLARVEEHLAAGYLQHAKPPLRPRPADAPMGAGTSRLPGDDGPSQEDDLAVAEQDVGLGIEALLVLVRGVGQQELARGDVPDLERSPQNVRLPGAAPPGRPD